MKRYRIGRTLTACALAGLLGACAQAPKPLYSWDAYQPAVYAYLKEEDPSSQVQALEKNMEKARATALALPPGFRAHLGMLYLQQGQGDKAAEQLQAETLTFPEATTFMAFLLRNARPADVDASTDTNATQQSAQPALKQQAKQEP